MNLFIHYKPSFIKFLILLATMMIFALIYMIVNESTDNDDFYMGRALKDYYSHDEIKNNLDKKTFFNYFFFSVKIQAGIGFDDMIPKSKLMQSIVICQLLSTFLIIIKTAILIKQPNKRCCLFFSAIIFLKIVKEITFYVVLPF